MADIPEAEDEPVLLGLIEYNEAKRIHAVMEERRIQIALVRNPETCATGGCKTAVEVYAKKRDLDQIRKFFEEEKQRVFAGLDVNPEILGSVYDSESAQATCPACGTSFPTTSKECPDCGLVFVTE